MGVGLTGEETGQRSDEEGETHEASNPTVPIHALSSATPHETISRPEPAQDIPGPTTH